MRNAQGEGPSRPLFFITTSRDGPAPWANASLEDKLRRRDAVRARDDTQPVRLPALGEFVPQRFATPHFKCAVRHPIAGGQTFKTLDGDGSVQEVTPPMNTPQRFYRLRLE